MTHSQHSPFNQSLYSGRDEPFESDRACYWYQLIQAYDQQKIGLVGFACDQGVRRNQGRVGAKYAPDYIRQTFAKLPCSVALLNQYGTDRQGELATLIGDTGNIECLDNNQLADNTLEDTQQKYSEQMSNIVNQNSLAIGLGGGHAIAYASYLGLWKAVAVANAQSTTQSSEEQPPTIGIINFDAHLDLRNAPQGTSGTPFRQIAEHNADNDQPFYYCAIGISQFSNTTALFDKADQLGVTIISDDDCYRSTWQTIADQLDSFMSQVDLLYVTIDMDAFPASVVPAVSAPAGKGITLDFVEQCLAHIFATGKVKVADIAEINPTYDIDGRSAKVASRLLALMIEQHLLQ